MIEKVALTFNLLEGVTAAASFLAPASQVFNFSLVPKSTKSKKIAQEAVYTLTPFLVCVLMVLTHLGFFSVSYFESLKVFWPLPSGNVLKVTAGDFFIILGISILLFDVLKVWAFKRKNHGNKSVMGIILSFIVFTYSTYLFCISPNLGAVFFLVLLLISAFDLVLWFYAFARHK